MTEAFYLFLPAVSDDRHARMVEEIADFGIYTVLADTDSFFSTTAFLIVFRIMLECHLLMTIIDNIK
jgi:hypothetical protein